MGYWSWLKDSIRPPTVWKEMKAVARDTFLETYFGYLFVVGFAASGIYLGIEVDPRYFLLLIGAAASFLMSMHGRYRSR